MCARSSGLSCPDNDEWLEHICGYSFWKWQYPPAKKEGPSFNDRFFSTICFFFFFLNRNDCRSFCTQALLNKGFREQSGTLKIFNTRQFYILLQEHLPNTLPLTVYDLSQFGSCSGSRSFPCSLCKSIILRILLKFPFEDDCLTATRRNLAKSRFWRSWTRADVQLRQGKEVSAYGRSCVRWLPSGNRNPEKTNTA